ncbi:MAG: TolC family protein [Deltaproteobacteria bacterium]|jgi:cobalt-zinc-cadmium efflux system outer membrane protein
MLRAWVLRAVWLAVPTVGPSSVQAAGPTPIDLESAIRRALENGPALTIARARVQEASGRLTSARTWPINPTLGGSANARSTGAGTGLDFEIGIAQQIEIGGQIGDRTEAASADLDSAEHVQRRALKATATAAGLAFVTAQAQRDLLAVRTRDRSLTKELFELARRRMERGAGTQLDLSAAASELARTETAMRRASASHRAALARLAEVMGADPALPIEVAGPLVTPAVSFPDDIVKTALAARADLAAVRAQVARARAESRLARARRWPNVTVRVFAGRENDVETLVGGGLSIPIPLFMRNQGGVEVADAVVTRSEAQLGMAELRVRAEVIAAAAAKDAAVENANTMKTLVSGTLEPNLDLLRRAFEAGKATWPEVLLLRRTFVEAEAEMIASEADAARATLELQLACGTTPIPASTGDTP